MPRLRMMKTIRRTEAVTEFCVTAYHKLLLFAEIRIGRMQMNRKELELSAKESG